MPPPPPPRRQRPLLIRLLSLAVAPLLVASTALAQETPSRPRTPGGFVGPGSIRAQPPTKLRKIETQYYTMYTDVPDDVAREAYVRLDRMFEEYALRTSAFSKASTRRLPFYLFSDERDYQAAGGIEGSAGVFMVRGDDARLMGFVIPNGGTWHVVQHEGFHQFAFMSISRNLPMWVNEGLAEYFGEAEFTGDSMVSGLIPEGRRQRVVRMIRLKTFTAPLSRFKSVTAEEWNARLRVENYDQAWSMIQFLAEGEGGRYQAAFLRYMTALTRAERPDPVKAWDDAFGDDSARTFEAAWKKYWLEMPEFPTERLSAQARMMTLTSFLARSRSAGQRWSSVRDFTQAARAGEVRVASDPAVWLPPSLLQQSLREATDDAAMNLQWLGNGNRPRLSRQYPDGTNVTVTFSTDSGRPRTLVEVRGRQSNAAPK